MLKLLFIKCLFILTCTSIFAQGHFVLPDGKSDRINFQLINNLIVFPVEVNGVELSFLLDTGVSKPIIFSFLNVTEELQINQTERIHLRGLGEGEAIEALKSRQNIFKIGDAININQDLYAVFDPNLNFAPRLGIPIHGIIGYDFLKDFIVEVNYSYKYIKLHKPEFYKEKRCRKCETFNIEVVNSKPYIEAQVKLNNHRIPVTLLLDSGGSDALWLFEEEGKNITIPEKNFEDFLGVGLSGRVFGKRSKLDELTLKSFTLKEVNVAFPDSVSISFARKFKDRSGSVSAGILKRFNIIYDYANGKLVLKKNRYFSEPFYYNKSGIELEYDGVRVVKEITDNEVSTGSFDSANQSVATQNFSITGTFRYRLADSFKIVELREGSPAHKAGLEIGDVILSINGKHAHKLSMQEVIQEFYGDDGKRIRVLVDRQGRQLKYWFRLEKML